MDYVFESLIAVRHIRTRRMQTFLSVTAITLAVAISLTSISLEDGFQQMLFNIIVEDLPHVSVSPKEGDDFIYLYRTLIERIQSLGGVKVVSPNLGTSATLSHKDNVENVIMIGVIPSEMAQIYPLIVENLVQGDLKSIQSGKRIVMGQTLADRLKVKLGDSVDASFPDAVPATLIVSGIFKPPAGFPEDLTYVSMTTARDFLNKGDVVSSVDVMLDDVYQADAVSRDISVYGYKAESWQQLYPEILQTLTVQRFEDSIILLLLMIIATFGIGSVMYLLVNEKVREIGMLMAMGASRSDIRNIFLIESGLLGVLGSVFGAILGLILSLYLKGLQIKSEAPGGQEITLPVVINPWSFMTIVLLAVILSIIAGAYPARKASQLDPVEALNS